MRHFTALDLDHETGITVIGHVESVSTSVFRPSSGVTAVRFTRVFWTNPDDLGDDEWMYDEQPFYVRPEAVRFACGLSKQAARALERAKVEAG